MKLIVDIEKTLPGFKLDISFAVTGETLGILGFSGAGKSMTLRSIAGLDTPDRGKIILNGRTLYDSEKGINIPARQRKIGYLFQNYALFPHLTVAQNIAFGLNKHSKGEQAAIVQEKIAMVHLEGLEKRYPNQLSGGQQQRVALARALANDPEILLLDEPFSALDNSLRNQMQEEFLDTLNSYNGVTLFVTHDLAEAYRVSKRLLILAGGQKVAFGAKEEIFRKPPNYTTAQITDCHNLSRVRVQGENQVEALDWGCTLRLNRPAPDNAAFVGIRPQNIKFVDDPDIDNTLACKLVDTNETPYRVELKLCGIASPGEADGFLMEVEVSKDTWEILKEGPTPWYICLDPGQLFVTEG